MRSYEDEEEPRTWNRNGGSRRRPRGVSTSNTHRIDGDSKDKAGRRKARNSNVNGGGLWALLVFLLLYGPAPRGQKGAVLAAVLGLIFLVFLLVTMVLYHRLSNLSLLGHSRLRPTRLKLPPHTSRDWSWWKYNTSSQAWLIFYNVFIPNETEAQQHAVGIISEQMKQVQTSHAFTASKGSRLHLFYNTIGTDHVLTKEWIHRLFGEHSDFDPGNEIVVHHGQHYAEANEDVTLQDLYDFCHAPEAKDHDDVWVIYLHSKGSFHYETPPPTADTNNEKDNTRHKPRFATQDRWRRLLTRATTHEYCLQPSSDCDTCSLLMQPLPSIHYPGNMWGAKASYIRKLVPPLGFDQRMDRLVVKQFTRLRDRYGSLAASFFPQMPHMMGRKRFAPEHWLGSSPFLLHPCHVSPTANLSEWLHPKTEDDTNLQMIPAYHAPGFPIDHAFWDFYRYGKRGETVLHNPTLRRRDYFLLPGQILKWYQLYGAVPPPKSWVWEWFPDAAYWQEQIQQHTSKTTGALDDRLLELWETNDSGGGVDVG